VGWRGWAESHPENGCDGLKRKIVVAKTMKDWENGLR